MSRIIGLTGNVGCGKSTVAKLLRARGVPVIDADEVSRQVDMSGVKARFGTDDRRKLRDLVFNDPAAKKDLEAILHPLIRDRSLELLRAETAPVVVYEAPLLIEAGVPDFVEGILVVICDPKKQLERMLARDPSLTPELAEKIRSSQMPQEQKVWESKWLIRNDGTLSDLEKSVDQFVATL